MKKMWAEFKKFISRGNVVDMAVGVAVAGAFTKIVTAFTNGFIGPILALLTNDANLTEFKWVVREAVVELDEAGAEVVTSPEVAILWGAFLQTILDFLIIALSLFIVMKVFNSAAAKAKAMQAEMIEELKPDKMKAAEAEAAAKAAAEAEATKKAAEEVAAKAAAEKQAELDAYAAQVAITENTQKLLTEIRDLLKEQKA